MKNPHLNEILPSGDKRLKRKAREPTKRGGDERLPYFKLYRDAHLAAETDARGSRSLDSAFGAAVDMRINAGEKPVSGGSAPAQGFPLERALPQRAASQAPGESAEPPRERAGEPSIKAIQQTRRLLANARERTRVHTISAAFEALRKQVPCYSYGQKLSKLAILRIACNYILSLAQLADLDYTPDQRQLSFRECVEQCTRTLQAEGRSKKRKE
ncbi:protein atonal homolog 8 [Puntigrus tetrazona]|uniref:protein atonal homolog 8 n=1 Tax=Puntigrus tetrazona TaxID=1606681 RepID=UPI001C8A3B70|nr:protein atonal homolog 8 [Puntigrus tetrazona]